MHKYRVDFSDVEYFIQIHEALMRDLDFPDYYGGNLDALWDCLTDILGDWAEIIITHTPCMKIDELLKLQADELTKFHF